MEKTETKPCENCGKSITKTATQKSQRKYWTCNLSCSMQLAYKLGNVPDSWSDNPYRGQKETRACAICGNSVTRYLSPKRIEQEWTCSYGCAGKQKYNKENIPGGQKPRTGDYINCSVCGQEFYRQPAYIKQGRHLCSRECNIKWQSRNRQKKICQYCGISFEVKPSQSERKFCSRECDANSKIKRPTGRTYNGKPVIENYQGYLTVYEPLSPMASRTGRVLEHRLIMAKKIGRPLKTNEHVNHINHDKTDNRTENLEIMNPSEHSRETNRYTNKKRNSMAAELAEYKRRFGELEDW